MRWLGASPVKMERRSLTAFPQNDHGEGWSEGTGVTLLGFWAARSDRLRSAADMPYP